MFFANDPRIPARTGGRYAIKAGGGPLSFVGRRAKSGDLRIFPAFDQELGKTLQMSRARGVMQPDHLKIKSQDSAVFVGQQAGFALTLKKSGAPFKEAPPLICCGEKINLPIRG